MAATIETYNIWRHKNPTTQTYLDANKLANVRWDIMRSKRLTDIELDTIKARVMQNNPYPVRDMEDREVKTIIMTHNEIQDIPGENITPAQNTTQACPDEEVLAMKTKLLRKWEVGKEKHIGERPSLPKIRKDWHVCHAIEAANKAVKEIKEEINVSLTLTDINSNCICHGFNHHRTNRHRTKEIQKSKLQKKEDTSLERKIE